MNVSKCIYNFLKFIKIDNYTQPYKKAIRLHNLQNKIIQIKAQLVKKAGKVARL